MIQFYIKYKNLNTRNISKDLLVVQTESEELIQQCIDMFNSEIVWDGMFTLKESQRRFDIGDRFFIAYFERKLFGYCWLTKVDAGVYKIYNVFSKKTDFHRKYGATDVLYYVIKNYTRGTITAEVDEWNTKSINVFKKLGFDAR